MKPPATQTQASASPGKAGAGRPSAGAIVAVAVLLLVSLGLLAMTARSQAANRDFISYWAGAKLLATHGNPYDATAVLKLENGVGNNNFSRPLVLRNTPATIFVMAPLGWFDFYHASMLWEALLIAAALLCIRLLQPLMGGQVPLILYAFAPVVDCFLAGQTTILVLLGICLFLRLEKDRPFWAGFALILALLKPHLLTLFWLVLLLEVLWKRRFRLAPGAAAGVALGSAIATALDPHIWTQYLASVRAEHIENQFFPNISVALRVLIDYKALWPQLLPTIVGLVLALVVWSRARSHWQWGRQGAMLLAASALVSPYSFLVDQVLFLPAVMLCYQRAKKFERTIFIAIDVAAFYLMLKFPEMSSPVTIWVAPAMMLWCWWIYRREEPESAADEIVSASMAAS